MAAREATPTSWVRRLHVVQGTIKDYPFALLTDQIQDVYYAAVLEKGKLAARRGRKATSLKETVGLPKGVDKTHPVVRINSLHFLSGAN